MYYYRITSSHNPISYLHQLFLLGTFIRSFVTYHYKLLISRTPYHITYKVPLYHFGTGKDPFAGKMCYIYQFKEKKIVCTYRNVDFAKICDWFVDNKLSIHFSEDKTKSILFVFKRKIKKLQKLEIIYNNIRIEHHS